MAEPDFQKEDVGFGDKNVETSQYRRYKGEAGRTDRIAFPIPNLKRAYVYWRNIGGQRQGFRQPAPGPLRDLVEKEFGLPEQRFGLVILRYGTDQDGEIIEPTKCKGQFYFWILSEARYSELSDTASKWPLLDKGFGEPQHDLIVKCTETRYQRMQFTPAPEAHWKQKEAWYNAIHRKAMAAFQNLDKVIGRDLPEEELRQLLGASSTPATPPTEGADDDLDLSEVLA